MPDQNTQNQQDTDNDQTFEIKPENLETQSTEPATPAETQPVQETPSQGSEPHEIELGELGTEAPAETQAAPTEPTPEPPVTPAEPQATPAEPTPEPPVTPAEPQATPAEPTPEQSIEDPVTVDETPTEPDAESAPSSEPEPNQEELDKKLEEQLADASSSELPNQDQSSKSKKYLIIGIVAIGVVAIVLGLYKFVFADTGDGEVEDADEPELTNSLSPTEESTPPPSEEMKELEEIVNELDDVYSDDIAEIETNNEEIEVYEDAVLEDVDDSGPPSFELPEADTDPENTSEDSSEKLLR